MPSGLNVIAETSWHDVRKSITFLEMCIRRTPYPDGWSEIEVGGQIMYQNRNTGERTVTSPQRFLSMDTIEELAQIYGSTDTFTLSTDRQVRECISKNLPVIDLMALAVVNSQPVNRITWANLPSIMEKNYRGRPRNDLLGKNNTRQMSMVKTFSHIADSYANADVLNRFGVWQSMDLTRYKETFESVVPDYYIKYGHEAGWIPPYGEKLIWPDLGEPSRSFANIKKIKKLASLLGIPVEEIPEWGLLLHTLVNNSWIHEDNLNQLNVKLIKIIKEQYLLEKERKRADYKFTLEYGDETIDTIEYKLVLKRLASLRQINAIYTDIKKQVEYVILKPTGNNLVLWLFIEEGTLNVDAMPNESKIWFSEVYLGEKLVWKSKDSTTPQDVCDLNKVIKDRSKLNEYIFEMSSFEGNSLAGNYDDDVNPFLSDDQITEEIDDDLTLSFMDSEVYFHPSYTKKRMLDMFELVQEEIKKRKSIHRGSVKKRKQVTRLSKLD